VIHRHNLNGQSSALFIGRAFQPAGIAAALALFAACFAGCNRPTAASPGPTPAFQPTSSTASKALEAPAEAQSQPETPLSGPKTAAAEPAAAAPQPASQRPPADRTPSRPGEAEKITFEDLNIHIQKDAVFREFMLLDYPRVKELDGKRISLVGYMYGGVATTRGINEFILLRNKECKFGPGGQADHLAQVFLRKGVTADYTPAPVKVEATLKVQPFQGPDGNTWSIYRLEDAEIR
jgi:hypothetical protein